MVEGIEIRIYLLINSFLLLVLHLLGLAIYVCLTVCFNWNKTSEAMKQLTFHPTSRLSGLIIIFVLILVPIVFQILSIFVHVLIGILAFIIWTFLFHQTWVPAKSAANDNEPAPAHEDTNDRTRASKNLFEKSLVLPCFSF